MDEEKPSMIQGLETEQISQLKRNGNRALVKKWLVFTATNKTGLHISELDKCDYKCEVLGFCSRIAGIYIFWDPIQHI